MNYENVIYIFFGCVYGYILISDYFYYRRVERDSEFFRATALERTNIQRSQLNAQREFNSWRMVTSSKLKGIFSPEDAMRRSEQFKTVAEKLKEFDQDKK